MYLRNICTLDLTKYIIFYLFFCEGHANQVTRFKASENIKRL
jgi:hypothetical protein